MPRPNRKMEKYALYIEREKKQRLDLLAQKTGKLAADLFREGLDLILQRHQRFITSKRERR